MKKLPNCFNFRHLKIYRVRVKAVRARAALRYGSGSNKKDAASCGSVSAN
jgi:hypothetical protein